MSATAPPRLAVWLLERVLPVDDRDEVIGDLAEEFSERVAAEGAWRARRWYWRHTLQLVGRQRALSAPHTAAIAAELRSRLVADVAADARQAIRSMRRAPGFAAIAVVTLSASLGLATAVFSIVNSVLLHPLPFATADRVVRLGASAPAFFPLRTLQLTIGAAPTLPSLSDVMAGAWIRERRDVERMAQHGTRVQTVAIGDQGVRVPVAEVGGEYFEILPVTPVEGRVLQPADAAPDAPRLALVSRRLVRQIGGGTAIGQTIRFDAVPHQIVGVLPDGFEWPDRLVDAWTIDRTRWPASARVVRQGGRFVEMIGLLRDGATVEGARAEGQRIADDLTGFHPAPPTVRSEVPAISVRRLRDELLAPARPALLLLLLGTLAVVVAANINLGGLIVSRNAARGHEIALRRALGASRWRLIRPLLCELLIIGAIGAAGAAAVAAMALQLLPLVAPANLPRVSEIAFNAPALAFAIAASLVSVLLVGLFPAIRSSARPLREAMGEGGAASAGTSRRRQRARRRLATSQVAVATVLLVGSALVARSLLAMLAVDPGYRPGGVLTFQTAAPTQMARNEPGRLAHFYATLEARLRQVPGVADVGTTTFLPMHSGGGRSAMWVSSLPRPPLSAGMLPLGTTEIVSANYLQTIGARLVRGRLFTSADSASAEPVAVVDETFVSRLLPGQDPLLHTANGITEAAHRIVGVIAPIKRGVTTSVDDEMTIYLPVPQVQEYFAYRPGGGTGVAVRTGGDPELLVPAVRTMVRDIDSTLVLHNVMRLDARLTTSFATPRFYALTLALFAALALTTVTMGVYGALASAVEARRVEFSVRRALGASTAQVSGLIFGDAARLAAIGFAIGLLGALATGEVLRSVLFGVPPLDPVSYLSAAAIVAAIAVSAAWLPARTATRADPARLLRSL